MPKGEHEQINKTPHVKMDLFFSCNIVEEN